MATGSVMGVGLRAIWKRIEQPPNPTATQTAHGVAILSDKSNRSQQSP
jgi:hypothetical protein